MTDPILDFATDESFRLRNWTKHREDPRHGAAYRHAADYNELDGKRFTRSLVFDHFATADSKGVISTIKWGYPRGTLPGGGWHAFSDAFRSTELLEAIQALRAEPRSAGETVGMLNRCVRGIGTATTTKIAYFARVQTDQGRQCLIYDSMVRRAIANSPEPEFSDLAGLIKRASADLPQRMQEETYGLYIASASAVAERQGLSVEAVELALFIRGRRLPSLAPSRTRK